MRYIGSLLIVFFVCSVFTAADRLVLCSTDGHEARIEPAHLSHTVCMTSCAHRCDDPGRLTPEIKHHHVRCTDLALTGNLGHIKDQERFSPFGVTDVCCAHVPARRVSETFASDPGHHSLRQYLQSVVLLI